MYDLFFENGFQLLGYGLFIAVPLYVIAFHFQQRRLWIACGVVTALIVTAMLVEWFVVTPREEVELKVIQLAKIVEQNDVEGLLEHLSQKNPGVISRASSEMPRYEFSVCNLMAFNGIEIDKNNPRKATADFLVRFNVSMSMYTGPGLRDVILVFEKEADDQWRIVDYSHYDPTNRTDRQNIFF